jgi:hypothetical protein
VVATEPKPRLVLEVPASARSDKLFAAVSNPAVDTAVTCHDEPLYILVSLATVLKYQSPAVTGSPLLSKVGLEACAPR